jgi:hypothetical protein
MNTLSLILLVFAFVLGTIAATWTAAPEPNRQRLIAASLAFFYLACILGSSVITQHFGGHN